MNRFARIAVEEFDHIVGVTIHALGSEGKVRQMDATPVFYGVKTDIRNGLIELVENGGGRPPQSASDAEVRHSVLDIIRRTLALVIAHAAHPKMPEVGANQVQLVFDDEDRNRNERPLVLSEDQGKNWFVYRSDVLQPTINWASAHELTHASPTMGANMQAAFTRLIDHGWNGAGYLQGGVTPRQGTREHILVWAAVERPDRVLYASPLPLDWLGELVHKPYRPD
jgi:hypothetical protein